MEWNNVKEEIRRDFIEQLNVERHNWWKWWIHFMGGRTTEWWTWRETDLVLKKTAEMENSTRDLVVGSG